jgi:hypothetical protein
VTASNKALKLTRSAGERTGRPSQLSAVLGRLPESLATALGLAAVALIIATPTAYASVQEFEKYPAEAPLTGSPARPQMTQRKARLYRSVLRTAAADGPNFNGHYRAVYWGCGTNCIDWAVINLKTGAVWFAKEPAVSCWAPLEPRELQWPEWIEVRPSSRLLYLHECEYGFAEGRRTFDIRRVYEWQKGRPVLLRTERFTVE